MWQVCLHTCWVPPQSTCDLDRGNVSTFVRPGKLGTWKLRKMRFGVGIYCFICLVLSKPLHAPCWNLLPCYRLPTFSFMFDLLWAVYWSRQFKNKLWVLLALLGIYNCPKPSPPVEPLEVWDLPWCQHEFGLRGIFIAVIPFWYLVMSYCQARAMHP